MPAVFYVSLSPILYMLTAKVRKRGIVCVGVFVMMWAMLMIGGTNELFGREPVYLLIGLVLFGSASSMVCIPVLPGMLETIEADRELTREYDKEALENFIAGLFVSI